MISLQVSLNKELEAGRFGNVSSGDIFMIVNDRLSAMLHIVEVGNGYCTFQLRGMEFKGTYCQEQELEEINSVDFQESPPGQCGLFPGLMTISDIFKSRWRSWEVINTGLMLRTYSISLNPATSMLNYWSLQMELVKYYVAATIYYLMKDDSLDAWLSDPTILNHVTSFPPEHADMDPIFNSNIG